MQRREVAEGAPLAAAPHVRALGKTGGRLNASPPVIAQRVLAAQLSASVQRAPRPNRTGLPDRLKSGIESLSGIAMDDVRVHRNSSAPSQLQAHAYAQGSDIHLAPGQDHHLPHEAWHVVQQKQGRVKATRQMKRGTAINDDAGLEREADHMGARAMQLAAAPGPLQARAAAGNMVQRVTEDDRVKLEVAEQLEQIAAGLGLPIFLGGGGAAALMGSGREIKDLDYKMSEAFKKKWQGTADEREELANLIVAGLMSHGVEIEHNNIGTKELPYVLKIEAKKDDVDIDISITSSGSYDESAVETHQVATGDQTAVKVRSIGTIDLALDKTFAFAERAVGDIGKITTDFIDICATLQAHPGWISSKALEERWVAYRRKWRRDASTPDDDPNGYIRLAPTIGLQVAMRTGLVLHNSALGQQWGLRKLRGGIKLVGDFARSIEKVAAADRLRVRDEILKERPHGQKLGPEFTQDPEKVPPMFHHLIKREPKFEELDKREQSDILRSWAGYKRKKDRLIERGRTKTTEYVFVMSRLHDLSDKYGLDL